ncbi:ankyrin [Ophiobolus disseminans]|uniref:Ankyrin n=1 Tax=Ophiobolus disseminans TaxID=1469910 RepID=A0A6A6ZNH3_9PLEO|nr:ankyrin [Ophiobolus disseminans]
MARRQKDEEEWDRFKDEILELYVGQDQSLAQVMAPMNQRGFSRTKAQHERVFHKWAINKNVTTREWQFIFQRLRQREAQQKTTVLCVRGIQVPTHRIQKQRKAHGYQTTFERCVPKNAHEKTPTPEDISMLTPVPSPSFLDSIGLSPSSSHHRHRQISGDLRSPNAAQIATTTPETTALQAQAPFNGIILVRCLNLETYSHPALFNPQPFLPPCYDGISPTKSDISFDIIGNNTYAATLKFFVNVISNNLDLILMEKIVVVLTQDANLRAHFVRLLHLNLVSMRVYLERLWIPAVAHGDHTLILALIKLGVDVNITGIVMSSISPYRTSTHNDGSVPFTALQHAIERQYGSVIDLLLEHGAKDWHANRIIRLDYKPGDPLHERFAEGTVVDLAVDFGDMMTLIKLLDCELRVVWRHHSISSSTLQRAIMANRHDLAEIILKRRPQLRGIAKQQYWSQLEPAIVQEHSKAYDADDWTSLVMEICRNGLERPMTHEPFHIARMQYLNIVQSLSKAGAEFPRVRQTRIRYVLDLRTKEDEIWPTDPVPYWDPWVSAITKLSNIDFYYIVQRNYINHQMSTAHQAQVVLYHGAHAMKTILKRSLPDSDMILDPLVLCALVYIGDELMVEHVVLKLIAKLGNDSFREQYGIKGLILAVTRGHQTIIHIFFRTRFDPFALVPHFLHHDLWRMDQWHFLQAHISRTNGYRRMSDLPIEFILQSTCSTPFQMACLCKDMEIIHIFLAWRSETAVLKAEQSRAYQSSAAYVTTLSSRDSELEAKILSTGIDVKNVDSTLSSANMQQYLRLGLQCTLNNPGQYPHMDRLLDLGADGDGPAVCERGFYVNLWWDTSLQKAASKSLTSVVKRLLARGVDVNADPYMDSGATPIQCAAMNGNFEIFQILFQAGGDINAPPCEVDGRTALEEQQNEVD